MSSAKAKLLKQINDSVTRKKGLAKEVSREKTIAFWVSEFFIEYEKVKRIDTFASLALSKLTVQLRNNIDRRCSVLLKEPTDGGHPTVEIHWSQKHSTENNCEAVMSLDASSAFFQSAMESI